MGRPMEEDEKKADKTVVVDSTTEKKEEAGLDVDYDKELEAEVEKFEKADLNREGYKKRKEHEKKDDVEEKPDIQKIVDDAIAKAIPKLQSSLRGHHRDSIARDVRRQRIKEKTP